MKENIIQKLAQILKGLGIQEPNVIIEHPSDIANGDYSTNVAMVYAKQLGMNPRVLAEKIVENLKIDNLEIKIAGAGFINFYLPREFFVNSIKEILKQKEDWGRNNLLQNKKVLVEHSSPNLFKPFHIGHVMNNTIGESIYRLVKYCGASVTLISYPSDVSLGIAKAVYVLLEKGLNKVDELLTLQEKLDFLGSCYVEGTRMYDEDESIHSKVRDIARDIFEHKEGEILDAYEKGKNINLDYFKNMTKKLGSVFDDFIYESEAGIKGKELVQQYTPSVFTESQSAVIYEGEKDGLHTRVFINKEGHPTYEAKDIGLLFLKFERYNPDISIFITDHEQTDYFRVVVSAAGKINQNWKDRTIHKTHGRMTFKGQKMSSRLGGVPTAQSILDTLVESVKEKAKNNLSVSDTEHISIAALKYTILQAEAGKNINFDPETSLSFEGNSGPYLLYSTLRAKSIMSKVDMNDYDIDIIIRPDMEIMYLEKLVYRFHEVVEESLLNYSTHNIVSYLTELAHAFNNFYTVTPILKAEKDHQEYYVILVSAYYQTMKNGLYLLGIKTPEVM